MATDPAPRQSPVAAGGRSIGQSIIDIQMQDAVPLNAGQCKYGIYLDVTTDPASGGYSALVPVVQFGRPGGPGVFVCDLDVQEGAVGVSAVTADCRIIAERVANNAGGQQLKILVYDTRHVAGIMVRNFAVTGRPSRATIRNIVVQCYPAEKFLNIGRPPHGRKLNLPLRRQSGGLLQGTSQPIATCIELDISATAVIAIDVWQDLGQRVELNVREKLAPTLAALRSTGIPILHAAHDRDIHPLVRPLPGETEIPGDFHDSAIIVDMLRDAGIRNLIYLGYYSNRCIVQRSVGMLEMHKRGFNTIFVRDASVAKESEDSLAGEWFHKGAVHFVELNFGATTTAAEIQSAVAGVDREAKPCEAFAIAKNRTPISGTANMQWHTAISLSFELGALPARPTALSVRVTVQHGYAGVGWYDEDGLAEEVCVGPGPCSRTVHLTMWNTGLCRSLIVRSVRREPLAVTLDRLKASPLRKRLTAADWGSSLDELPNDCFLDTPFKGSLAEALWRSHRERRWHDPDWRFRRLKLLVSMAWQNCPGYRSWWSSQGWHPSDLQSLEDAAEIPAITKEQIRVDLNAFSLPRRNTLTTSTSGSSGQPFLFRYTRSLRAAHSAQLAVACSRAIPELFPWQTRIAALGGRAIRGLSATGAAGSLVLAHVALREPEILVELLQAYQPTVLYTFPSSAAKLAEVVDGKYRFRSVVLSSENILPFQIRAAEQIADKVICTYGLSEGAAFAQRCPSCGTYGELPGYGLTTLRHRSDGLSDIIGTGFWSLGTLFIGYVTGDLTAGPTEPCPDCAASGLHFSTVLGREHDTLVDRDGVKYTVALLYRVLVPYMPRIKLYDFLQEEPGDAILRYITYDGSPLEHELLERALGNVVPTLTIRLRLAPELMVMHDTLPVRAKWKIVKTAG